MAATIQGPDKIAGKPRRRRHPAALSLRVFVTMLVVLGMVSGWEAVRLCRRQAAMDRIAAIGGGIEFAEPSAGTPRLFVFVHRILDLLGAELTMDQANALFKLVADIDRIQFRPDEKTFHKRSACLRIIGPPPWHEGPTVNDTNLGCIGGLPDLKRLDLSETNVGDAGMQVVVSQLGKLEELVVGHTDVSDASVPVLVRLQSLKVLDVCQTNISPAGISELHRALPSCSVCYDLTRWDSFVLMRPDVLAVPWHSSSDRAANKLSTPGAGRPISSLYTSIHEGLR